ncbi:MAG: hypothetical protein ACI9GM_000070 [Salibacteraceae bacterium]|jgi:hypothetical protein
MTRTEKQRLSGRIITSFIFIGLAILFTSKILPAGWGFLLFLVAWTPKLSQLILRRFNWAKSLLIHPANILNYSENRTLFFRLSKENTYAKLVEVLKQNHWVIQLQNPNTGEINSRTVKTAFGNNMYLKLEQVNAETQVTIDWVDFRPWGNPNHRDSKITDLINQFEDSLTI